jgi:phosphoribosylformimino-5-aminoimidazole carboxamide ribonucleotide (ProFAR) isomerase
MIIIPAIDIIGGKAVRLTKGDYNQKKIYNEDPLEVAKMFEESGIKRLHLVDLDGAKQKRSSIKRSWNPSQAKRAYKLTLEAACSLTMTFK